MSTAIDNGIVDKASNHSVEETVERLKNLLLLIFGKPKAGTPLMLAAPSITIDLPLKILIREDTQGKVWLSYNSPQYLQVRHGLPQELLQNIAAVQTLADKAAE